MYREKIREREKSKETVATVKYRKLGSLYEGHMRIFYTFLQILSKYNIISKVEV